MGTGLVLLHGGAFVLALALLWWREQANARMAWRRPKAPA